MTLAEAWERSGGVAKCEKTYEKLCKFEPYLEEASFIAEQCANCGKRVGYRQVNGRIDEEKYLRDHVRSFVQPSGPTRNLFIEIYGTQGIKRYHEAMKGKKKPDVEEFRAEAWDTYKTVKKLLDSGKQVNEI